MAFQKGWIGSAVQIKVLGLVVKVEDFGIWEALLTELECGDIVTGKLAVDIAGKLVEKVRVFWEDCNKPNCSETFKTFLFMGFENGVALDFIVKNISHLGRTLKVFVGRQKPLNL